MQETSSHELSDLLGTSHQSVKHELEDIDYLHDDGLHHRVLLENLADERLVAINEIHDVVIDKREVSSRYSNRSANSNKRPSSCNRGCCCRDHGRQVSGSHYGGNGDKEANNKILVLASPIDNDFQPLENLRECRNH